MKNIKIEGDYKIVANNEEFYLNAISITAIDSCEEAEEYGVYGPNLDLADFLRYKLNLVYQIGLSKKDFIFDCKIYEIDSSNSNEIFVLEMKNTIVGAGNSEEAVLIPDYIIYGQSKTSEIFSAIHKLNSDTIALTQNKYADCYD